MWALAPGVRIYLALSPVDMRKSFDGLSALVADQLARDPLSGQLFVFRNRLGDKLKLLWWDGQGFCIFYKRLEQGTFRWPQASEVGSVLHLSVSQLQLLVEGLDWRRVRFSGRATAVSVG